MMLKKLVAFMLSRPLTWSSLEEYKIPGLSPPASDDQSLRAKGMSSSFEGSYDPSRRVFRELHHLLKATTPKGSTLSKYQGTLEKLQRGNLKMVSLNKEVD